MIAPYNFSTNKLYQDFIYPTVIWINTYGAIYHNLKPT